MIQEVALITVSCVLFIQMGLSEAITDFVNIDIRQLSCPKCVTFWTVLVWTLFGRYGIVHSVATSFIAAYCAVWLAQLYDILAIFYNRLYDKINEPTATEDADQTSGCPTSPEAGRNEVS